MRIETLDVAVPASGVLKLRFDNARIEVIFEARTTIAPEMTPQANVEIIYQCGSSEFVLTGE